MPFLYRTHRSPPHPPTDLVKDSYAYEAAIMTSRKTQQEIDKTFKKVAEGIQSFEGIYDKIKSSSNAAQRDKLEDNLKREIKKLQRFRDQIKTWAAGNEVKDKGPLLEQRRAIETVRLPTFSPSPARFCYILPPPHSDVLRVS